MSTGGILLLGALAGLTIFCGLPLGRMRGVSPKVRTLLNSFAIGVLVFLVVDVLTHAVEPLECRLDVLNGKGACDGGPTSASWLGFTGFAVLAVAGFGVGLLALVYYDRFLPRRRSSGGSSVGPGAAAVAEFNTAEHSPADAAARRLAFLIALGIGLHNFAEGLAIGQSAARDEITLALMLVIGFGLHNATEGFGIVGPLAGRAQRPSWGFLATLGLIGGGPTFVGTVVGQSFASDAVSVLFLALAAGSILYVIVQLVGVALRSGFKEMLYWGVFLGVIVGFVTDFIIESAGA